jgi:hypothetical protein
MVQVQPNVECIWLNQKKLKKYQKIKKCAKMSVSVSASELKLSENFKQDFEKFLLWVVENNYKLRDLVTGEEVEWNEELLQGFNEPGRNKLETFVKELTKRYFLVQSVHKVDEYKIMDEIKNQEVDDIKSMIKQFKENKPRKVTKRKVKDENTENKKQKKTKEQVKVDFDIDTSKTHYLVGLPYSTQQLINALGEPRKTGNVENSDKHEYEWKVKVGSNVFSIYNWMNTQKKFPLFEDNEWHLGGKTHNKKKIELLCNYIDEKKSTEKPKIIKKRTMDKKEMIKLSEVNNEAAKETKESDEEIQLNIDDIVF